jgi:hypothetical protein
VATLEASSWKSDSPRSRLSDLGGKSWFLFIFHLMSKSLLIILYQFGCV